MRVPVTVFCLLFFPLIAQGSGVELPLGIPAEPMGPPAPVAPSTKSQAPIPCTKFDLHAAVQFVKTDCLSIALRNMDVNDRDVDGDTPLHNAIHFWNPAAIRMLLRNGADIHLRDFQGRNAIDLAWALGHHRLYDFLQALEREDQRLLEAIDNNDAVAVNNSLNRGATLGMRDLRLDTPLHRAAQSGLTEVGKLLVQHGANLEARNYLGETALHVAALRDFKDFMKMLVEAGANVNALDERRRTPLDLAELHSDPKILTMLQKKKARRGSPASVEFDFEAADGELVGAAAP
ncbi:MAG: ankyrin repeat domain-containing protein [Bdellovibrionota bacterium]